MKFPKAIAIAAATLGLSRGEQLALDSAFGSAARDEEGEPSSKFQNKHIGGLIVLLNKLYTQQRRDDPEGELSLDSEDPDFQSARYIADGIGLGGTKQEAEIHGTGGRVTRDNDPATKSRELQGTQETARGDRRPRRASDSHLAVDARTVGAGSPFAGCHDQYLGAAARIVPSSNVRVTDLLKPNGSGSTENTIAGLLKPVVLAEG